RLGGRKRQNQCDGSGFHIFLPVVSMFCKRIMIGVASIPFANMPHIIQYFLCVGNRYFPPQSPSVIPATFEANIAGKGRAQLATRRAARGSQPWESGGKFF
ncbi:MAG: hypothetical protein LBO78_00975, partial [Rickettsiales bacterium]|nr:hypothetical protein [Rickettsiales bacterium]